MKFSDHNILSMKSFGVENKRKLGLRIVSASQMTQFFFSRRENPAHSIRFTLVMTRTLKIISRRGFYTMTGTVENTESRRWLTPLIAPICVTSFAALNPQKPAGFTPGRGWKSYSKTMSYQFRLIPMHELREKFMRTRIRGRWFKICGSIFLS